jgi:hypothetical protein
VTLVVARRVFPEIAAAASWPTDGLALVSWLGDSLIDAGVKAIALEGRVPVKNARNPLWNADLEVEALGDTWKLVDSYRNCRWLEPA